jgi:diaminopimelate decarboxylase/aspartate kinase
MPGSRWAVLKFGGTSVASVSGWAAIEAAVQQVMARGERALVVCSALAGVSSAIEAAIDLAERGERPSVPRAMLGRAHHELADALGVELPGAVEAALAELDRELMSIARARQACPRTRARLMGLGEQMSTRLGVAWLRARGLPARWTDARDLLVSTDAPELPEMQRFLQAEVVPTEDPVRMAVLREGPPVVLTQGFVGSSPSGEPVLLGRGGSDTSAAVLGAWLQASRVEIWTDVPGMFTGNPADLPEARLLDALSYDEAFAMATLGAKVLHPRTIRPVRTAGIPLHVRSTYQPHLAGTVIRESASPGVKAVTSRSGLTLVRMRRPASWQPVGFLADISACFQRHGLSIDLLSASSGLITATLDPLSAPRAELDGLLGELERVCAVEIERPVASVSLVGTALRSELARMGPALAVTAGVPVHALVQGASDHHLTLVVDESARAELLQRLHAALFEGAETGPSWRSLARDTDEVAA